MRKLLAVMLMAAVLGTFAPAAQAQNLVLRAGKVIELTGTSR